MRPIKLIPIGLAASLACAGQALSMLSPQETRALGEKAYVFAYPIVLMEFTRRMAIEHPVLGAPEMNQFAHAPAFPTDAFRQVIRPNADTLYSSAWLDLSREPQVLHVPDTHDRYYLMQFMDAWTETFNVPGKRTTGTQEGWFAVVGPGWKGTLPARTQRIDSPTNMVWLLGRTQTNGPADYEFVHSLQKGYTLMPLSLYPDGPRPAPPNLRVNPVSGLPTPPIQVARLSSTEFFETFAHLLETNPPHPADAPMVAQLARAGIVPGRPFDSSALNPDQRKAFEEGARAASARLEALGSGGSGGKPGKTGWTEWNAAKVGRYGTDYVARAAVARIGLGANAPEDAIYLNCSVDADAKPFRGTNRYRIHFTKDSMPPVDAFWSITMYSDDGYFVKNPINRFAIGDRDPLKFNSDGSLDIYIQSTEAKDRNWLPSPEAGFNLTLRMYWPKQQVLSGNWTPPAVTREQ